VRRGGFISIALFAAATLVATAAFAQSAPAEPRLALVIGNAAYRDQPLANSANDARGVAASLHKLGFTVIERIDAGKAAMESAILEFGDRLRAGGVGLFYYAGHGIQSGGRNYLLPVDVRLTTEASVRVYGVDSNLVTDLMSDARNRANLVILDACRNNPFVMAMRGASKGLAAIDAARGTLIAYSTAPGQVAADGDGPNSPYTGALLKALDEPGLKAEELFKRVRRQVADATKGAQTPWESSSLTGDLILNLHITVAPAGGRDTLEAAFWNSIAQSNDAQDFEDYLKQFPSGTFSGLAKRRLDDLRRRQQIAEAEAEKKRQAAEAEKQRLAALEAERQRKAAEEVELKRLAAVEAERKRQEKAEMERLAAEESAKQKAAAAEAERQRLGALKAEHQLKAAEAEKQQPAALEAERQRKAAEGAERQRIAAEETEKKRQATEVERLRLASLEAERRMKAAEDALPHQRAQLRHHYLETERQKKAAEEAERTRREDEARRTQQAALPPRSAPPAAARRLTSAAELTAQVYEDVMAFVLQRAKYADTPENGPNVGKPYPYRQLPLSKAYAVCVDWAVYYSRIFEGSTQGGSGIRHHWGNHAMRGSATARDRALANCTKLVKANECECQAFDEDDRNVLKLPDSFVARVLQGAEPPKAAPQRTALPAPSAAPSQAAQPPKPVERSEVREKAYHRIMELALTGVTASGTGTGASYVGKSNRYRALGSGKAMAVCVYWSANSIEALKIGGWSHNSNQDRPSMGALRNGAMEGCVKSEPKGCKCQIVDENDKNVLQVPDDFYQRLTAK
jgi:hypothetical protein